MKKAALIQQIKDAFKDAVKEQACELTKLAQKEDVLERCYELSAFIEISNDENKLNKFAESLLLNFMEGKQA